MRKLSNVFVLEHALIKHKLAVARDSSTETKKFRELIGEITAIMTCESMRDINLVPKEVETPLEKTVQHRIKEKSIAVVAILRAGLGMVDGVLDILPTACVGHIGISRDEKTLTPNEYYCKLPEGIEDKTVILVDPMLATGGSADDALNALKKRGCKDIRFLAIVGAPEGVEKVATAHPDVKIYLSALDRELDKNGYIRPGLGDAGDRLFGTK
ncbi:MAG: uracil phosphoribosyltransferase [Clostridia bacterium]|nr:uracil phosphoribosyltransferase [Clostridia bacterium]